MFLIALSTFKQTFNCFFDILDISGHYLGVLHIIYLILSA